MTYILKHSGRGGLIVADYRCPDCDVFTVTVARIDGGAPTDHVCDCGIVAPWTPSAPKMRVDTVVPTAAIRGGDMKDRPPGMLSTRDLADGMPMSEWKAKQDGLRQERRHQQMIAKGIKSKRIQTP